MRLKEFLQDGGLVNDPNKIQSIINKYGNGKSPFKASDYIEVSKSTGVPVELLLAQGIQESNLGTKGMAVRTHNVGNVGNNGNTGKTTNHGDWKRGLVNMANLLKNDYKAQSQADIQRLINTNFLRPTKGGRYAEESNYGAEVGKLINSFSNIKIDLSQTNQQSQGFTERVQVDPLVQTIPDDMKKGLNDYGTFKQKIKKDPSMLNTLNVDTQKQFAENARLENERMQQEAVKSRVEQENLQIEQALKAKQIEREQILSMVPQSGSVASGNIQAHLQKGGQVDKDKIYDNRDIQEVVIHPNNFQSIESDSLRVEKKMDASLNLRNQKGNNQIKKDIIKDNTPWYIKGLAPTTTSKANNIYNELSEHYNVRNRRPVYTDESSSKLEKEIANKVNSQIGKYSNKELELRSKIKNAQQYGYIEGIGDLDKFVENIEQGKKQDLTNFKNIDNDNRQLRDALNSKYYGINQGENHITESQYRPSKAKNNNTTYYDFHPNEKEKLLRDFVDNGIDYNFNNYVDQRQNSKGSIQTGNFYGLNQLNNYTLSGGEDKNGKYISYYDIWDLAGSGNKNIDESLNKINNPFEIYGRIYEKDLIEYKKRNKSKQSNKQK